MAIVARVTIGPVDLEINQPADFATLLNTLGASLKPDEAAVWWSGVCEYLDDDGKACVTALAAALKDLLRDT